MKFPAAFLWSNRGLVRSLTVSAVASRYRTSWFGMLWPVVQPVLLIGVFAFVFAYVMPLKWVADASGDLNFAIFLYSGLVVFTFFAEVISRAPALMLERPNLIKKVVFPVEVLALVSVGTALVFFLINLLVFLLVLWFVGSGLSMAWPLVFLFVAPLCLFLVGLSWFLSALTVYVRDVAHVVGIVVSAMMFFTPVFYPLSSAPDAIRPFLLLNPLTVVIEGLRALVMTGASPDWPALALLWLVSIIVFQLGWMWFRRLREGFADVL